jgi:hypothetical protein
METADMAIQVGGAREGQSFVLKIQHLNFGKLPLLHLVKKVCAPSKKPNSISIS